MNVVLDTNVFISGIFWEGNASSVILDYWRTNHFTLISSSELIDEFVRIFKGFKIKLNDEVLEAWKNVILENALIVRPLEKIAIVFEDPSDNKFIEAAVAGDAQYLVSQDKHLLKLNNIDQYKSLLPMNSYAY